jgi:hypothetical protein
MNHGANGNILRRARELRSDLRIETNASSETIIQWLEKMFRDRAKPKGFLRISTRSGRIIDVPEA